MRTAALLTTVLLTLGLSIAPGPTSAGTAEEPEITDPLGDVGGAPGLAGPFAWADLAAAWFDEVTDTSVRLTIQVAEAEDRPAWGEVAVVFGVGETFFATGFGSVAFPVPPFVAQGGFYCETDENAQVVASDACGGLEGLEVADGRYSLTIPRAAVGLAEPGARLVAPRAYSMVWVPDATAVELDWSAPGRDVVFPADDPSTEDAPGDAPAPAGAAPPPSQRRPVDSESSRGTNDAPLPGLAAGVALVIAAFVGSSRWRPR